MRGIFFQGIIGEIRKDDYMPRILEEFAYGNVSPKFQCLKKDTKYDKAVELVTRAEKKLEEKLSVEDMALVRKLMDAQDELNHYTAIKNAIYGYRLGLVMTAEAFTGLEDLYRMGEDL